MPNMLADRATRQRINKRLVPAGMRACSRCLVVRSTAQFNAKQAECKTCRAEYAAARYAANSAAILEQQRDYYAANADARREYSREYRTANAETAREQEREYKARKRAERDPQFLAHRRAQDQRRRARKRAATVEHFTEYDSYAYWAETADLYGCYVCGAPIEHLEHFVPLSKGGAHSIGNTMGACTEHNLEKGARMPLEYVHAKLPHWFALLDKLRERDA